MAKTTHQSAKKRWYDRKKYPRTIGGQPVAKRFSGLFSPIWRRQHQIILIHGGGWFSIATFGCTYNFNSYMQELPIPPDLQVHFRSWNTMDDGWFALSTVCERAHFQAVTDSAFLIQPKIYESKGSILVLECCAARYRTVFYHREAFRGGRAH